MWQRPYLPDLWKHKGQVLGPAVGRSLIVMFHHQHNPDLCIIRSWEGNCVKIIQFRLWSLSPIQMVTEDAAVSPAVCVMTISQYYPPRWHPTYINYSHTPGTNSSQDWPLINKQLNISNTTKLTLNLNPLLAHLPFPDIIAVPFLNCIANIVSCSKGVQPTSVLFARVIFRVCILSSSL